MKTATRTEVARSLGKYLNQVIKTKEPLIVTVGSRNDPYGEKNTSKHVAIICMEDYDLLQNFLEQQKLRLAIQRGESK